VVDSGGVGVEKPDPQIFDHAFEIIDVPKDGAWYVGDTPGFDVVGARRAGLMPILMDPHEVNGDFGAVCVHSLGEVAQMIENRP
jgi:FMN phosphatase YigB (HAD superfamily)